MEQGKWWERRLFQPKNIEGEPVKEELDYVRDLLKSASERDPRLKGITIIGSTLKGYTKPTNENPSDVDIAAIYDSSFSKGEDDFAFRFEDSIFAFNYFRKQAGLPIFTVDTIESCDVKFLVSGQIRKTTDFFWTLRVAEALVFPGVGDIEIYRKIIREEINEYSIAEKENWLKCVVTYIEGHMGSRKFLERGMIKQDEEKSFLEARKKLLEARVRRIFG